VVFDANLDDPPAPHALHPEPFVKAPAGNHRIRLAKVGVPDPWNESPISHFVFSLFSNPHPTIGWRLRPEAGRVSAGMFGISTSPAHGHRL
jgi:hypothetical protein